MDAVVVIVPVERITDWESFHDVFQQTLGFPDFYGRNMDAWIDCMTSVDVAADGLSTVVVSPGGTLVLRIDKPRRVQGAVPRTVQRTDRMLINRELSAFRSGRSSGPGTSPEWKIPPKNEKADRGL